MYRRLPVSVVLFVFLAVTLPGSGFVLAQIDFNRCIGEDGVLIYTDRACDELSARERGAERVPAVPDGLPNLVEGCARQVETLRSRLRDALESRNVNSLAGLYHWAGASTYTAETVMPSLEAVARRSLVGMGMESVALDGAIRPVTLWLDQYDPQRPGETVRSRFRLVENAGCWWLQL